MLNKLLLRVKPQGFRFMAFCDIAKA
jgi:hypothetical protein